jgi:hypothetical protein
MGSFMSADSGLLTAPGPVYRPPHPANRVGQLQANRKRGGQHDPSDQAIGLDHRRVRCLGAGCTRCGDDRAARLGHRDVARPHHLCEREHTADGDGQHRRDLDPSDCARDVCCDSRDHYDTHVRESWRPQQAEAARGRLYAGQLAPRSCCGAFRAHTPRHRVRMHRSGRCDQLDPGPADTQHRGLRAEQQPPRPLIQIRTNQRQTRSQNLGVHNRQRHTTSVNKPNRKTQSITARVLTPLTSQSRCPWKPHQGLVVDASVGQDVDRHGDGTTLTRV